MESFKFGKYFRYSKCTQSQTGIVEIFNRDNDRIIENQCQEPVETNKEKLTKDDLQPYPSPPLKAMTSVYNGLKSHNKHSMFIQLDPYVCSQANFRQHQGVHHRPQDHQEGSLCLQKTEAV